MLNRIFDSRPSARFIILFALTFVAALGLPRDTAADSQTLLRPDPLSVGLKSGEQGAVSILVDNAQQMYGVEFHLQFDPDVVEVVDADSTKPGVQIKPGDWLSNTFVAVNKVDNETGKIDFAVTLLNPAPPVSGSGPIATITFKAKNDGNSPLKVDKEIIASREGNEIKSVWQNGAIGVSPLGAAPGVDQTTHSGSGGPSESSQSSQALPVREIVLLGAAGMGMLAFIGALIVAVAAIVVFRRR